MTKAPSVNQMRFLSSSALPNDAQLILAASCSAADAIESAPCGSWPRFCHCRPAGARWPPRPPMSYMVGAPRFVIGRKGSGLGGLALEQLNLAAGLFDGRDRALRSAKHLEAQLRRDLPVGENFDAVTRPRADAR